MKGKGFPMQVRSRHGTHDAIRGKLLFPVRTLFRLGSTTPTHKVFPLGVKTGKRIIEINSVEAVRISSNKLLMKQAFDKAGVNHAVWAHGNVIGTILQELAEKTGDEGPYPIVAKHIFGSRGEGNYLLKDRDAAIAWAKNRKLENYIFECYFSGVREYRLHTSVNGCFYGIRKMLKTDTPEDKRWFRNDENSVWIMEDNKQFDRPANWNEIVDHCVRALKAEGLDVAAFDVRVQSAKDSKGRLRENPAFILLESNSAPSFGQVTTRRYLGELSHIVEAKM